MTITGGAVMFASVWFLVMFLLLPWGQQTQEEAGHIVPGTPAGAPVRPGLGKKALWATVISVLLVGAIWMFLASGIVTRADMMDFNRLTH